MRRGLVHATLASAVAIALMNACTGSVRDYGSSGGQGGAGQGAGGAGQGGESAPCSTADECPAPRSLCHLAACEDGTCSAKPAPMGAACADGNLCDADGQCVECNSPADCDAVDECGKPVCEEGLCIVDHDEAGTPCGAAKVCNEEAKCVDCYVDDDCTGTNEFCDTSGSCLSRCFDKVQNGTETDVDCGGTGLFGCEGHFCGCNEVCVVDEDCETFCLRNDESDPTGVCFCD